MRSLNPCGYRSGESTKVIVALLMPGFTKGC